METRRCTGCEQTLPLDSFGTHMAHGKRRIRSVCKTCRCAEARAYRQKNLEAIRVKDRERGRANAEQKRRRASEWYYANKERAREQRRRAYERNTELVRDRAHMARAKKAGAPEIELVRRRDVYERDAGVCHVCDTHVDWDDYEMDHVLPLSEGGAHTYGNVRIAHKSCNLSRRPVATRCPHGHDYTPENTYQRKNGSRSCRACARERARQRRSQ